MPRLALQSLLAEHSKHKTRILAALHPVLSRRMTRSEQDNWPTPQPYSWLIAVKLLEAGLAILDASPLSPGVALGFVDLTPEEEKERFRILNDTLWINCFACSPDKPVSFRDLKHVRLLLYSSLPGGFRATHVVSFDLEKAFYQVDLPMATSKMMTFLVLHPSGAILRVRLLVVAMGFTQAVDIMHLILLTLCEASVAEFYSNPQNSSDRIQYDPYVDGVSFFTESLRQP